MSTQGQSASARARERSGEALEARQRSGLGEGASLGELLELALGLGRGGRSGVGARKCVAACSK